MSTTNYSENIAQNERAIPSGGRTHNWLPSILLFLLLGAVVGYLWYRLDNIEKQTRQLFIEVSDLRADLDLTSAIARNADMYAHSHSYSDIELKTDFREIDNPLEKLLQLKGVRYYWTEEAQTTLGLGHKAEIGLVAQDVEQIFPELVWTDTDGFKHMDYDRLTVVLLEALRDQNSRLSQLEERINLLEWK